MGYTVQVRSVESEEWREVGTFPDAAYCMRLAEASATAETESRIVRAIRLVDAPTLCRFRRAQAGALLVEERSGRLHVWQGARQPARSGRRSILSPPLLREPCEGLQGLLDASEHGSLLCDSGVGLDHRRHAANSQGGGKED